MSGGRLGRGVRLAAAGLVGLLAACGADEPTDYSDETRTNVLTACSGEADRPLVGDVCTCTYRTIRTTVAYQRLAEIDEQLRDDPGAPLPDEVVEALAGCIIEVGDL